MKRWLGHTLLKTIGWKEEGQPPTAPRFVIIAAPHTSNWDLPIMVAVAWAQGIHIRWLAKHTLFFFPLGPLLSWLGGIPVRRSERRDMVQQMAALLNGEGQFALVVPPEGTRSARDYWRSGFYRIAEAADVPISLGFLDYGNRRAGLGASLTPTGDVGRDMDVMRAFYADKRGLYPEKFREPRLRDEDEEPDAKPEALRAASNK